MPTAAALLRHTLCPHRCAGTMRSNKRGHVMACYRASPIRVVSAAQIPPALHFRRRNTGFFTSKPPIPLPLRGWDFLNFSILVADPSVMMFDCFSPAPDSFRGPESGTPLSLLAEAFEDLARAVEAGGGDLHLRQFSEACSFVSVLFGYLGLAFKFAEMEYVSKVNDLLEASKTYDTLCSILDDDVKNDSVRKQGSHSRNLRRVRLGLDLIKVLFEQFVSPGECSLRDAASSAYTQVCAPYHTWAIRKAVGAGMYALPTREELLLRLSENEHTVQKEMTRYIVASNPVIKYIDNLYLSRAITLDW